VTVTIYDDVQGQRIRQLQLGQVTAGRYVTADQAAYWDGKSETGEVVSSGTYFYQLLSTSGWRLYRDQKDGDPEVSLNPHRNHN
jgi:flagellar hook assembly protein FlgD